MEKGHSYALGYISTYTYAWQRGKTFVVLYEAEIHGQNYV